MRPVHKTRHMNFDSMNRKKILFFSCEPGGAEVILPVIKLLQENSRYEVMVAGYGYAAERFRKKGLPFTQIFPVEEDGFPLLRHFLPDLVITSAASHPLKDMSEKYTWYHARKMRIPTFAFLDQWQNYTIRFSGKTGAEKMAYLPDYINCINHLAETEMIREGFPPGILFTLGHPYLSGLKDEYGRLNPGVINRKLERPVISPSTIFISEAISEYYGDSRGYTQYEAMETFFKHIESGPAVRTVLLKLHPKEEPANYRGLIESYQHEGLSIILLTDQLSPVECLAVSDRIYGMTSLMMIEAFILGKPVVTVQPNLRVEDPMVLSRYGYIPRLTSTGNGFSGEMPRQDSDPFEYRFSGERFLELLHSII